MGFLKPSNPFKNVSWGGSAPTGRQYAAVLTGGASIPAEDYGRKAGKTIKRQAKKLTDKLPDLSDVFGGGDAWTANSRPQWKGQLGSREMPGTGHFQSMLSQDYNSPAMMQLQRQRDINNNMMMSQIASQRGLNPAAAGRLGIMQGAQQNQLMAGQAAELQTKEQAMAAQQLNEQEMFRRKQLEAMMALEAGQYAGAQDRAQRERGAWMQMIGTGIGAALG